MILQRALVHARCVVFLGGLLSAGSVAGCSGGQATVRGDQGTGDDAESSGFEWATQTLSVSRFDARPRAGEWAVIRAEPVHESDPGSVLGWARVLAPAGESSDTVIELDVDRFHEALRAAESGPRLEVVGDVVALAAVADKRLASVRRVDGDDAVLDRGSIDLVTAGDLYGLGEPARPDGTGWALYRVREVDDATALVQRVSGDRFATPGDRVRWLGPTVATGRALSVDVLASDDVDAAALVARALTPTSLSGRAANVVRADGPCRHGASLAASLLAEGRERPDADSGELVVDLRAAGDRIAVGWTLWPRDLSSIDVADLADGCFEGTQDQAAVLVRLAALRGEARWRELAAHARPWVRDGGLGDDGNRRAAAAMALAALESGDSERAIEILEGLDAMRTAAGALLMAQTLHDLGRPSDARTALNVARDAAASGPVSGAAAWMALEIAVADGQLEISADAWVAALPPSDAWAVPGAPPYGDAVASLGRAFEAGADPGAWATAAADLQRSADGAFARHPGLLARQAGALARRVAVAGDSGALAAAERLSETAADGWREIGQWYRAAGAELERLRLLSDAGADAVTVSDAALRAADDLVRAGALGDAAAVRLGTASVLQRLIASEPDRGTHLLGPLVEALRSARVLYSHANDVAGVARTWFHLGEIMLTLYGDRGAAADAFDAAALYALRAGDAALVARAELGGVVALAGVEARAGEVTERLASARSWAQASGDPQLIEAVDAVEARSP